MKNKRKMLSLIILIITIILGCLLYVYREIGATGNLKRDDDIRDNKENGENRDRKIKELDSRLHNVENMFLKLIQFNQTNKNLDSEEAFQNYLKEKFGLNIEQLGKVLEEAKSQNKEILQKALAYYLSGDYEESLRIFKKLVSTSSFDIDLAIGNSFIGNIYLNHLEDSSGINIEKYLKTAFELFENLKLDDDSVIFQNAELLMDLGIYYRKSGDINLSSKYYIKALGLYQKLNSNGQGTYDLDLGRVNHNLFVLYNDFDNSKAEEFLTEAYEYKTSAYNTNHAVLEVLLNSINSLVNYYSDKDFLKVQFYFDKGESLLESDGLESSDRIIEVKANLYANYGFCLSKQEDRSEGKNGVGYMEMAEKEFGSLKSIKSPRMYGNLLHNLGVCYTDSSFSKAENYYLRAIEIRKKTSFAVPGFIHEVELAHSYLSVAALYSKNMDTNRGKEFALLSIELYNKYLEKDESLRKWAEMAKIIADIDQ